MKASILALFQNRFKILSLGFGINSRHYKVFNNEKVSSLDTLEPMVLILDVEILNLGATQFQ